MGYEKVWANKINLFCSIKLIKCQIINLICTNSRVLQRNLATELYPSLNTDGITTACGRRLDNGTNNGFLTVYRRNFTNEIQPSQILARKLPPSSSNKIATELMTDIATERSRRKVSRQNIPAYIYRRCWQRFFVATR